MRVGAGAPVSAGDPPETGRFAQNQPVPGRSPASARAPLPLPSTAICGIRPQKPLTAVDADAADGILGCMTTSIEGWISHAGGVAHSSLVRRAGFSAHHVSRAVEAGRLRRVRRSWLVSPDCPADRVVAASLGGRVSCLSAAVALGLWVTTPPTLPHISVPHSSARLTPGSALVHWARGPVPLAHTDTHEHPINVLFHVARCAPRAEALATWESALRRGLVDAEVLARVTWRSTAAAELAGVAGILSDSGIETAFVHLLRGAGITVRQQVWVDGHPLDGLIGERLGIQIDGLSHHQGSQRRRDLRADARLALRGYTLLRFDYQQVLFEPAYVIDTIRTALAQGRHRAR